MFQYIYQSARQYNFTVNQGEPTKIFLSWSPVNKSLNMMSLFGLFSWWIREGLKKSDFYHFGVWPYPPP